MADPRSLSGPITSEQRAHATAIAILSEGGVPFAVGGYYAFHHYTGVFRVTKDLDIFVLPEDVARSLRLLRSSGFDTHVLARHWLAKAYWHKWWVDLVFGFGNWMAQVDSLWIERGPTAELFGLPVRMVPIEEMIWVKAFVAHRESFHGADVVHLIWSGAGSIDWDHLLGRFGDHWEVLASYVLLFQYVYPSEAERVPKEVRDALWSRLLVRWEQGPSRQRVCRGTVLDRFQYLYDVVVENCHDAREELAQAQGLGPSAVERDREVALRLLRAGKVRHGPAE